MKLEELDMEFFTDMKEVYCSINIVNSRGFTVTRNFPDVHQFAKYLKEHKQIAEALLYVEKKKK